MSDPSPDAFPGRDLSNREPAQEPRVSLVPSAAAPFEILEWKLVPPRSRAGSVPRTALIAQLESARSRPLAVVSAGPGWGKTALLAQWATGSPRPVAWVSVDDGDNDPVVLLTYVATALARVTRIDAAVFEALASPGASVEAAIVPRLCAALAASDSPLVLVLDDLHALHDRSCLDAVATLARSVRDGAQLAVSARGAPDLQLDTWHGQGAALELGPEDLRMDEGEARQLLEGAGLDVPAEQVAALLEQTEGWPAGLFLAALSIRAHGDATRAVVEFSGNSRVVAEYLRPELLAHRSAEELRFLTHTAVLERMSGVLCDELLETNGSRAMLESLVRSNLFVVSLDDDGEWYRYHHLFRELLRSELERSEPALAASLLARASAWCEANGQPGAAIAYAQQAGDVARVGRLVERWALSAYRSGRVATVEHWFDWMEERGALERNAGVAVLGALLATLWGQPAKATRLAEVAEGGVNGVPSARPAAPDASLLVLRALRCAAGVERMRADAERAVAAAGPGGPMRPSALLMLAIARWLDGEIDGLDDLLAEAAEKGGELTAPETSILAHGERAAIAIGRGAWVEGEESADRALRLIDRWRAGEHPSNALVCALAARVALHGEKTERAHAFLSWAQRLRPNLTYALPHVAVQTRLELARAYLAVPDAAGARTVLREIDALLRRRPDLGILNAQVKEVHGGVATVRARATAASALSAAELRLVPYLATPLTFREIGERRDVSRHTVRSQVMSIYRKLGVSSRTHAVEHAREIGLL
jgi:LuxR family maltose regulon positive regulatory protein